MTTMIERVARAIFVELGWEGVGAHPSYDHDPKPWEDAARAAIEAMREPTDAMVLAGAECPIEPADTGNLAAEARTIHRAMISAALKEQP